MRTKLTKNLKDYFKKYQDRTLSKKLTNPVNIADFILYLINKNNNITGQTIFIDGGVKINLIIPTAGRGSRLGNLTLHNTKNMVNVLNKPIFEHQIKYKAQTIKQDYFIYWA